MDGTPLELFAATPWSDYLKDMARNSTYGDQLTLQAVANLCLVELIIISTLGPEATTIISPQNSEPMARLFLGHFSEDDGIHYVNLLTNNERIQDDAKENENES